MRKQFRAPWDYKLIAITSIIVIFLGSLLFLQPGLIASIIIWSTILGTAAFGIYGYSIQDGKLKIIRLGWSKDIELADISNVENKMNAMMGSIRSFGIGGMFGYIGHFKNSILGHYKAYATNSEKTVLIEANNQKYIVTPDDPEEFIESLKQSMQ